MYMYLGRVGGQRVDGRLRVVLPHLKIKMHIIPLLPELKLISPGIAGRSTCSGCG